MLFRSTYGLAQHLWEDFTSQDYKNLPAVGAITYFDPFDAAAPGKKFPAPGNGRGYYRPATLVSIWATAPYLHNNSVGIFTGDPSVAGRMKAFEDGISKLLVRAGTTKDAMTIDDLGNTRDKVFRRAAENRWKKGSDLNGAQRRTEKDHGLIWRTPHETTIRIPAGNLPNAITNITGFECRYMNCFPWLVPAAAMLAALFLLLSANDSPWRFVGHLLAFVVLGVVLAAVYIVARRVLNQFIPLDLEPLKIGFFSALGLIVIGFAVVAWLGGEKMLVRWVGYFSFKLEIPLAFAAYFFAGRLGDLEIGPIPAGTPVNLLANLGPDPNKELDDEQARLKPLIDAVIATLDDLKMARWDPHRDRKSTRLNSSHIQKSRMPSSA